VIDFGEDDRDDRAIDYSFWRGEAWEGGALGQVGWRTNNRLDVRSFAGEEGALVSTKQEVWNFRRIMILAPTKSGTPTKPGGKTESARRHEQRRYDRGSKYSVVVDGLVLHYSSSLVRRRGNRKPNSSLLVGHGATRRKGNWEFECAGDR